MKTILVSIAMLTLSFVAAPAAADWTCGDIGAGFLDTCTGDTNTDNPYAACDGQWRDLYDVNTDTYVQLCQGNDGSVNVYVCPMANPNYSYNGASCVPVNA